MSNNCFKILLTRTNVFDIINTERRNVVWKNLLESMGGILLLNARCKMLNEMSETNVTLNR